MARTLARGVSVRRGVRRSIYFYRFGKKIVLIGEFSTKLQIASSSHRFTMLRARYFVSHKISSIIYAFLGVGKRKIILHFALKKELMANGQQLIANKNGLIFQSVFCFNPASQAFPPSHLGIACKQSLRSVWRRFRFPFISTTRSPEHRTTFSSRRVARAIR